MRTKIASALALSFGFAWLAGCGPDPLLGTYDVTTTGANTTTQPSLLAGTAAETGMGTVAITTGSMTASTMSDYQVVFAINNLGGCEFNANNGQGGITFPSGQTCTTNVNGNDTTFTLTAGTATFVSPTLTITLSYTYSGTTDAGDFAFSGNGMLAFTGAKR